MNETDARERIAVGLHEIQQQKPKVERRERYERGQHDKPFAPDGVNEEYQDLQDQSIANWITLAVNAPVQRIRADQFHSGSDDKDFDKALWRDVWQANNLDDRQSIIYREMMMHGRGIASVWTNKANKARPIVRPESNELVYLHPSDDDPFTHDWTVKTFTVSDYSPSSAGLILPGGTSTTRSVAIVYDDQEMRRYEKGGRTGSPDWVLTATGTHPMGENPFVAIDYRPDAKGQPWSPMDPLIPQQDAINTIRFNTLLAMQFSAFRQRIIVGFDPVMRDKDGNPVYERDANNELVIDPNGNPVPVLTKPGRAGVDRILAFPGADTKVFDLPESNLKNYIEVLSEFLTQFFATGQIPPQYLLSRMANLSGDALTGAESTLASLVKELQLTVAEGGEGIFRRAARASGRAWDFPAAELLFADAEARSFTQIVDGITKLIAVDFPRRSAFEMLPGATKQKVDRWMTEMEDESFSNRLASASRAFIDTTPPASATVTDQTGVAGGASNIGG